MLNRETILGSLRQALEPLSYFQAMWEGGAAAFDRTDEWSDIDLMFAVDDGSVSNAAAALEAALLDLAPFQRRLPMPPNIWHGHWQCFYQLEGASPYLMIDAVIMKTSATNKFLEREIHGQARVHFDKTGFVQTPPLDRAALLERLKTRVETLRVQFPMFQTLITKELPRGNSMEAAAFYQGYLVRPLVELLRIQYAPYHHDFFSRYLYYDLPSEVVRRLEPYFFVSDTEDLARKRLAGEAWFNEILENLDWQAVAARLEPK